VLVVGGAALVAYWSRNRPVDVTVIYDFGAAAPRVSRVTLSYARKGEETQPVALEFPTRTPRRYRHTLRLIPGEYTIRARVYLEATDSQSAEVRHHHRRVTIEGGEDQRLTLRLAR
jgi:nitrogen fixation protein FixH